MKDAGTRRKLRTRKIEVSKYIHLISYNYLKNIVKNLKFKNKNVKKQSKLLICHYFSRKTYLNSSEKNDIKHLHILN